MQKKLLAAAMAAAFVSPTAFAQGSNVTIYGLLQPSVDFIDTGDESGTSVQGNTSRIGFSGTEDLGNGLKAIFQIETLVNLNTQGEGSSQDSLLGTRDSWVGLSGAFGSFTLGNHQTASVRGTSYLDPFADSIGDYNDIVGLVRRAGANAGFDSRINNSLYYTSPKFGAFQVLASYALAANNDIDDDADEDNVYAVALTYSTGP
ncbi:MAG TPA: porin, partial [Burkholderiales bacterium]|nr:porin [Burkholderiales bacterium]